MVKAAGAETAELEVLNHCVNLRWGSATALWLAIFGRQTENPKLLRVLGQENCRGWPLTKLVMVESCQLPMSSSAQRGISEPNCLPRPKGSCQMTVPVKY